MPSRYQRSLIYAITFLARATTEDKFETYGMASKTLLKVAFHSDKAPLTGYESGVTDLKHYQAGFDGLNAASMADPANAPEMARLKIIACAGISKKKGRRGLSKDFNRLKRLAITCLKKTNTPQYRRVAQIFFSSLNHRYVNQETGMLINRKRTFSFKIKANNKKP